MQSVEQSDLTYLTSLVHSSFQQLATILSKTLKENHPTTMKVKKKLIQTSECISKLKNYSKHLAAYNEKQEKQKQRQQRQLLKEKSKLLAVEQRLLSLEMETMQLRKKLNEAQQQIKGLTVLNKLDISFTESIEFCEQEEEESMDKLENSFDSFQIISQSLELYSSQNEGEEKKGENLLQQHGVNNQIYKIQDISGQESLKEKDSN